MMKKIRAGMYQSGKYYTYRDSTGWWSVGEIVNNDNWHMEDFRTLRDVRAFIAQQNKEQDGREN